MAFTTFYRERVTFSGTIAANSSGPVINWDPPTDRVCRVHVHGFAIQNGAHASAGDNFGGEAVIKNNNGTTSMPPALTSSTNALASGAVGSGTFGLGYSWVNDVKNGDSSQIGLVITNANQPHLQMTIDPGAASNSPQLDYWLFLDIWEAGYA